MLSLKYCKFFTILNFFIRNLIEDWWDKQNDDRNKKIDSNSIYVNNRGL